MTLEELKKTLSEDEQKIFDWMLQKLNANLQTEQQPTEEQPRLERWKPTFRNSGFFWIETSGDVKFKYGHNDVFTNGCISNYNCFQTREEAEQEALRTRARRRLEWLARELNKSVCRTESGQYYIIFTGERFEVRRHDFLPILGGIIFNTKEAAEYALSQMTAEELEALR